ncbi:EAL domain-containing protein [Pseudoxanthomonas dokdonensis]|uniref:EAL domain-containing protein n=1 Tax=Pseudoxanthomonas dokdonensis TaxID=344882 RepID=A0A0R0CV47_9GAMM|nr:bifunctional diguanylate cyclase/phosphodiesterase [Pseudoxanthomonas dokdonensis]KRG69975.1 hypothetical protein ABB29_06950 [Pseudoxanthomonas dokdonensis]
MFTALGLGLLCVLLQQVPAGFRYWSANVEPFHASLVHLHVGLLMALVILCRDRWIVAGAFFVVFLGWCVRQWLHEPDLPLLLGLGLPNLLFGWAWAIACAHWAGWPKPHRLLRIRRSDLGRLALFVLLLYPLGSALIAWASMAALRPAVAHEVGVLVFFARYFGIAIVTLPLMVAWAERRQPAADRHPRWRGWPLLLLLGVAVIVASNQWVQSHGQGTLLDYRFVLLVVLAIFVLRLRPLYSMPLLSLVLFALVVLIARHGAGDIGHSVAAIVALGHSALEVFVLLFAMIYLRISSRDRRELAALVLEETLRDTVTGLPNLRALRQRVNEMQSRGQEGWLGYLVLDHAESVATGVGLDAQATVISTVANRISSLAGIHLVGTGQLALLCLEAPADGYWERILNRVKNARIDAGGHEVHLQPYLGVCSTPIRSVADLDAGLLVSSSLAFDARGRGELVPNYSADGAVPRPDPRSSMQAAAAAFDGLRNERLSLYFQPIARLQPAAADSAGIRGEVLCRLYDIHGQLMQTPAFMPYIEAAGRGAELDLAVIRSLFRLLRQHPQALPEVHHLGINITGQSLSLASFRSQLLALLAESPLPLGALCFEVTERASIVDVPAAGRLLQELREMGARIAIDDFGTGMQSFDRLKQLPVDIIKIDGSFVSHMAGNPSDHAIIEASVAIAHAFGASTVAEFVESRQLAELLCGLGVDEGQGDFFGAPRPLPDVLTESAHALGARMS